jgi:hypothetical protein
MGTAIVIPDLIRYCVTTADDTADKVNTTICRPKLKTGFSIDVNPIDPRIAIGVDDYFPAIDTAVIESGRLFSAKPFKNIHALFSRGNKKAKTIRVLAFLLNQWNRSFSRSAVLL